MMAKAKTEDPWHYPGKGDFPLVGELVWVQAVSLAPWAKAVVNSEPVGSPVRFQTESMYGGKLESTGVHYWENLSCHDVVVAWRKHESPEDHDEVLKVTENAQRAAGKNDSYLFYLLASALGMNPKVMKAVIQRKMERFKKRLREIGETAFVNAKTPVVDTYCPDFVDERRGLVFVVEEYNDHGVIRQTEKGKSGSRYAKDFTLSRTIYPTPMDAAQALIAEAKKQGWRAVV